MSLDIRTLFGAAALAAIAIWLGNLIGLWWLAPLCGFLLGLLWPNRLGLLAAAAAGAAGWALGLLWDALHNPLGPTASAVTGILGLGGNAVVSLLLTVLIGAVLGVAPAWLAAVVRQVVGLRPRAL